ncbi:unnamed protein product, partial [Amoebophrya sp. A25]|eukprot:GSA25T00012898001.1
MDGTKDRETRRVFVPEVQYSYVHIVSISPHITNNWFGWAASACACLAMKKDGSGTVQWKQLGAIKWLPLFDDNPPCPYKISQDSKKLYKDFHGEKCTRFLVHDMRQSLSRDPAAPASSSFLQNKEKASGATEDSEGTSHKNGRQLSSLSASSPVRRGQQQTLDTTRP